MQAHEARVVLEDAAVQSTLVDVAALKDEMLRVHTLGVVAQMRCLQTTGRDGVVVHHCCKDVHVHLHAPCAHLGVAAGFRWGIVRLDARTARSLVQNQVPSDLRAPDGLCVNEKLGSCAMTKESGEIAKPQVHQTRLPLLPDQKGKWHDMK